MNVVLQGLAAFRSRPLGHVEFPYVFCDATYLKDRVRGQVVSRAVVVATGITANGDRSAGPGRGRQQGQGVLCELLRSLRARGLSGVRLVISDHHLGLKEAISEVMIVAGWQRCRVHLMRTLLARVPRANAEMVAAAVRTIFAQPDAAAVAEQFERVTTMLDAQLRGPEGIEGCHLHDRIRLTTARTPMMWGRAQG